MSAGHYLEFSHCALFTTLSPAPDTCKLLWLVLNTIFFFFQEKTEERKKSKQKGNAYSYQAFSENKKVSREFSPPFKIQKSFAGV